MPSFELIPRSAKLVVQAGEGLLVSRPQHFIVYDVAPGPDTKVRLASKENFREIDGRVTVKPSPVSGDTGNGEPIGAIHYVAAVEPDFHEGIPSGYIAEVEIPQSQFMELLATTRAGRLPAEISVEVVEDRGIKYGWEPDGRGKEWDNLKSPKVPISEITIAVPLIASPQRDDLEEQPAQELMPPTRTQIGQLGQQIEALRVQVARQHGRMLTILVVVSLLFFFLK